MFYRGGPGLETHPQFPMEVRVENESFLWPREPTGAEWASPHVALTALPLALCSGHAGLFLIPRMFCALPPRTLILISPFASQPKHHCLKKSSRTPRLSQAAAFPPQLTSEFLFLYLDMMVFLLHQPVCALHEGGDAVRSVGSPSCKKILYSAPLSQAQIHGV